MAAVAAPAAKYRDLIEADASSVLRGHLVFANLAHRRVVDQSSTALSARKTCFASAACTGSAPRRDGARAPLSCGETSLGSDSDGPSLSPCDARSHALSELPDWRSTDVS